jgi:hypothetical protein
MVSVSLAIAKVWQADRRGASPPDSDAQLSQLSQLSQESQRWRGRGSAGGPLSERPSLASFV